VQSFIPFLLGLLVAAGVLVPLLLRFKGALAEAARLTQRREKEAGELRQRLARQEQDQQFLTQFLKEFPTLARALFAGIREREIPGVLLGLVLRSLRPERAVLIVRRTAGGEVSPDRMVVAAVAPADLPHATGTEVPVDTGELALVCESQLVMGREDLATEDSQSRIKPGPPPLPGFEADLIAPLVFDQDTLGLILLSRPQRSSADARAALRLIAQTGAQALNHAVTLGKMKNSAELDGLTGVFNKVHLAQTLSELIYRAACAAYDRREGPGGARPLGSALSVFLFDIDHFKNYNDVNGHLAGDRLLKELASLVQGLVRKDDVFGRFGGEEFLLVLPDTDAAHAMLVAEKVRTRLAEHRFAFGPQTARSTRRRARAATESSRPAATSRKRPRPSSPTSLRTASAPRIAACPAPR